MIKNIIDLQRYPLNRLSSEDGEKLVKQCQHDLAETGLFNLQGFLLPEAIEAAVSNSAEELKNNAFKHQRKHNIYFLPEVEGLEKNHPALKQFETINHTVCSDRIPDNVLIELYEWKPFADFLAAVMEIDELYPMDDELSRLNVMGYTDGEALNWHFDRSEFTTTLLLQTPQKGGEFQYKTGLRTDTDPNYDGIGEFLAGDQADIVTVPLEAGTLNVFRGKNTLHRVSPVVGNKGRVISVFSYYEKPGVKFSADEQMGFLWAQFVSLMEIAASIILILGALLAGAISPGPRFVLVALVLTSKSPKAMYLKSQKVFDRVTASVLAGIGFDFWMLNLVSLGVLNPDW